MVPRVFMPPNTNNRFIGSGGAGPLASSSGFPSSHTVQGNIHMEWSRRFGGRAPLNFIRSHLHLSASRKYKNNHTWMFVNN